MSNKNERIDLTQFEDVKGPWEYNTDDDGWTLATIHERDNPDRDEFIVLMRKPNGDPLLTMNPNLSAITMVPELIAELKRCYYEIDLLREYAKCGNCGGRYIGPMDYGLHEWEHSEDCDLFYDNASE